ncbi:MAG: cytochrome c [Gammaproteobacteria bacterium]|nr:cytochrome c [Gammaproteobacteria bacterium]
MPYTPPGGYLGRCALCHENNGMAEQRLLALYQDPARARLSLRDDLTPAYIRQVVRNGHASMPPMSRVEVPDTELNDIVAFLTSPKTREAAP